MDQILRAELAAGETVAVGQAVARGVGYGQHPELPRTLIDAAVRDLLEAIDPLLPDLAPVEPVSCTYRTRAHV
jgi:hypothetical protein